MSENQLLKRYFNVDPKKVKTALGSERDKYPIKGFSSSEVIYTPLGGGFDKKIFEDGFIAVGGVENECAMRLHHPNGNWGPSDPISKLSAARIVGREKRIVWDYVRSAQGAEIDVSVAPITSLVGKNLTWECCETSIGGDTRILRVDPVPNEKVNDAVIITVGKGLYPSNPNSHFCSVIGGRKGSTIAGLNLAFNRENIGIKGQMEVIREIDDICKNETVFNTSAIQIVVETVLENNNPVEFGEILKVRHIK